MEARFDRTARDYEELMQRSIGWSRVEHAFFVRGKARHLLDLIGRHVGDPGSTRVVDVGCGIGLMHGDLTRIGELHGVDESSRAIARARAAHPHVRYAIADAVSLPYEDDSFDAAFTVGVLHHVAPMDRDAVVAELARVTRRGGLVVVFEHNPLNPLTRLAVARCDFDDDAVLLGPREARARITRAGLQPVDQRYIFFFPWRGAVFRRIENALRALPFGAQYYVAAA